MQVSVEYTAQLRRAAGVAQESFELPPGSTVQQLAGQVAQRHGDQLAGVLLSETGTLQRSMLVFVDDEQIPLDWPQPLRDGQRVTFAAPISGG